MAYDHRENMRRYRREGPALSNPSPTSKGRTGALQDRMRSVHDYNAPTIGRIFAGVFVQPLSAECRTVEIVRFAGADHWKARVKETRSIVTRLGQQVEYASDSAAISDITDYLKNHGMRMIRQWDVAQPQAD